MAPASHQPASVDRATLPMAVVDPECDLANHSHEQLDSWFIAGTCGDGKRQYGYHLHCLRTNEQARPLVATTASITDLTNGDFHSASADDLGQPARLDASELLIEAPLLTLRGDPRRITACARFDGCFLKLDFTCDEQPLFFGSVGLLPYMGTTQYNFALTGLPTTGALRVNRRTRQVSGMSWFDRQWGPLPGAVVTDEMSWLWACLNASTGDRLSIGEVNAPGWSATRATIRRPDGSHVFTSLPQIRKSSYWISPESGNRYPTELLISIPAEQCELEILINWPQQEVCAGRKQGISKYAATGQVRGELRGQRLTQDIYVEMSGLWP